MSSDIESAAIATWPRLVEGDYSVGVVRLVTLARDKVNYLLFASVELLPTEMPVPPEPDGGGWWNNFGTDRICLSRTVLPLGEALKWYETLKAGQFKLPASRISVKGVKLSPEPDYNGFTLPSEAPPFSPSWHGRPRVHRLVPMEELAAPVRELRDHAGGTGASARAREWLREHIHFDLLAYDDWLGAAALVAPNPLMRSCGARIGSRSALAEVVEVGGPPRRGADLSTLRVAVEEMRAGAPSWREEGQPDELGRFRVQAMAQVVEVGHDLFCRRRGLLDRDAPGYFFRSVHVTQAAEARVRTVAPPKRDPSLAPRDVLVRPVPNQPPASPPTALDMLQGQQRARAERVGQLRPLEQTSAYSAVRLHEHDREGTVRWICGLIAEARSQIVLVDPYLDADDLQEFATAAAFEGVAIRALINPRPGRSKRADASGEVFGDQMIQKIKELRNQAQGFGEIDVRVSNVRRLHDRFLQVDDTIWHAGHSFNQMGRGEISLMTLVAEPAETRKVISEAFAEGEDFETHWLNRVIVPWSFRRMVGQQLRRAARWVEQS